MTSPLSIEKIVFFGTADIAVPALRALYAMPDCRVAAVCTQPDRPAGRKRVLTPSPVKVCAEELGLKVLDPERIADAVPALEELNPDLGVVFAYGQYMPRGIFELPRHGCINFHPSRLPAYRGASPVQSAIRDGLEETALSVIRVDAAMDAGDILDQQPLTIDLEDTTGTLSRRFAELAAGRIPALIRRWREQGMQGKPQCGELATECRKIAKADGMLDWSAPARQLCCCIRAYQPWPGTFFPWREENLKVLKARVESGSGKPGTVLSVSAEGPLIACGEGSLRLLTVQVPGKRAVSGGEFLNGHPMNPGDSLSEAIA